MGAQLVVCCQAYLTLYKSILTIEHMGSLNAAMAVGPTGLIDWWYTKSWAVSLF